MGSSESVAAWDRFWSGRDRPQDYYRSSAAYFERLCRQVTPGCRMLEIGPGTGQDAAELATLGARVVALDSSEESLALMRRGVPTSMALLRADGLRMPFRDESFDVVYHQGLLEHFRDPLALLHENHRVLRPGGILVVDVPQTFHAWTAIKKVLIVANRWFAGWETQYTPRQLTRLVESAGFHPIDVFGDWMHPSLAYRCTRTVLAKLGLRIPKEPPLPHPLGKAAHRLARSVMATSAGRLTALSVGVVGRKASNGSCIPKG